MIAKAYVFDFDGTLVDSMSYWGDAVKQVLDEEKVEYPDNIVEILTPLGYTGMADYFVNNLGLATRVDRIMKMFGQLLYEKYRDLIPAKSGVYETLTELKGRGQRLYVLTAGPHVVVDVCLKRLGVYELFDAVWSTDDFGMVKSDPRIYLAAAERIGVQPSDIAFFDDNITNIKTAKTAGLRTFGVYDPSGDGFADELKAISDNYVVSFSKFELI